MSDAGVSVEYIATGANRQTAAADWSQSGVLAFGAQSNVALWRPCLEPPQGVFELLSGHTDTVKAVRFLPEVHDDDASYLVTGSDDKTLLVWKSWRDGQGFGVAHTSTAHQGAVNCITAVRLASRPFECIMATGAADATIRIWTVTEHQLELVQTIHTAPKFFPLALSLSALDSDQDALVLAAAGTRDWIQMLTAETDRLQFDVAATLSGHEGWIRCLDFVVSGCDLLLASASQDKYVRIWRLHKGRELPALAGKRARGEVVADTSSSVSHANSSSPLSMADTPSSASHANTSSSLSMADTPSSASHPGSSPSNKAYWLKTAGKDVSLTFEALLLGHDDWIYSARWHHRCDSHDELQLLTASADNSLAMWEADAASGIWVSTVRLGEISREKGATTATGSTGGFWTGLWSPDGRSVACLGRTGSWRRWQLQSADASWRACVAVSGHTRAVTGIAWSGSGDYLLSTGSDQTTRLHGQWTTAEGADSWHEMARPQIHGYDLNCIDWIGSGRFVSGADEKLMRVFDEPRSVARLLDALCRRRRHHADLAGADSADAPDAADTNRPADTADMPVLGLSNKAIVSNDDTAQDAPSPLVDLAHPPLEETLSRHTLWPETEKLYGHGYEISCLAVSHDGSLIASACKASSINHAVIRLFDTTRWTELRPPLTAHSLTATRLRFSPTDRFLLSVGRDRQWAVFERVVSDPAGFRLVQTNPKGHSRMLLDAAWAPPCRDCVVFATAGRDKHVRIWALSADTIHFSQVAALPTSAPATSVDFLHCLVDGKLVLAVGTETGLLSICLVSPDGSTINPLPPHPRLHGGLAPTHAIKLPRIPSPQLERTVHYVCSPLRQHIYSLRSHNPDE